MGRETKTILKGFTLIELLIVIVIISIMASLAIPSYLRTVEKVRAGEAITNLELIRAGEKIYRLEYDGYTGTLSDADEINTFLNLDIEPRFWTYDVLSGAGFLATAARNSSAPSPYNTHVITLDQDGTWAGNSDFVP